MARLPRLLVPGQPLHLIHRGIHGQPVFRAHEDCHFYLACLKVAAEAHGLAIHAYVLMPNHVHLLATPETERSLAKTMQSTGRRYVQYFNQRYGREGTLWETRYKCTVIEARRHLLDCMRYVELNPVRAAMVARPGDYPWSSYGGNAMGDADPVITAHALYLKLAATGRERQKAYRQLFRAPIPAAELQAIREATNKAWVLGGSGFCAKVEALIGRRAAPLPRGRPRRDAGVKRGHK